MITFIQGKPGGGKTLHAVHLVLDELCAKSPRNVVTNIYFNRAKVAAYIAWRRGITQDEAIIICDSHLWHIDDDKIKEFYRYRGALHPIVNLQAPDELYLSPKVDRSISGRSDSVPDFSSCAGGVLYLLDEVQNIFNARGWKDAGSGAIYYLSQHRKLGDDVILISQHPELVDKQFRLLVHEWHTVRNRHQDKVGPFKLGSHFLLKKFYVQPNTPQVIPFEEGKFDFKQNIAECYDTMAGVGVKGRLEPSLRASKGPPLWTLYATGACVVVFAMCVVYFTPSALAAANRKEPPAPARSASSAAPVAAPASSALHPASSAPLPIPSHVPYPLAVLLRSGSVLYSDGSRKPLSDCGGYVLTERRAIVSGFRIPVEDA